MNIVQVFPGKIWGGAEQYIDDLGSELSARGHNVIYVSRFSRPVITHLEKEGKACTPIRFSWSLDSRAVRELSEIVRDADVVNIHSTKFVPLAILACRRSGSRARVILTRHEAHRTPVNPLLRGFFRRLDKIVFVSALAKKTWIGSNRWFPDDKCTVVHNSIPPYSDRPVESLREKYGISPLTPLIVFSGRVRESKGCSDIIRALSTIAQRDFAAVFLGSCHPAGYERQLMKLAGKGRIADRVHIYGFTSDARQLMSQADIGVSPSIVRDSFLLSNIEFMQNGVPVITTDNGGQPEYITSGVNGMLVPPKDYQKLAAVIADMLDDEKLRRRIGETGREYFNAHLSYDRFVDRILEVYEDKA
ncbi:MAG: glycosyltransferase family 4 protein [Staphylococcus sp.]|nr:glycosyltransferase family 4 protein [Staphylococcus sp.]